MDTPYAQIGVEYRWHSADGYRGAGTQRYAQTSGIYESVAAGDVMATAVPCDEVRVEKLYVGLSFAGVVQAETG